MFFRAKIYAIQNNTKKYFIDLTRDKVNIKINLKKSVSVPLKSINLSTIFSGKQSILTQLKYSIYSWSPYYMAKY